MSDLLELSTPKTAICHSQEFEETKDVALLDEKGYESQPIPKTTSCSVNL